MKYLFVFGILVSLSFTAHAQLPSMGGAGKLLNKMTKKGLSDDAFKPEFKDMKKDFLKQTKKMTNYASLGGHINKLIGFIKPGMFKEGVDVAALMEAGKSLASIADATGLLGKLQGSLKPEAFQEGWDPDDFSSALDALS